MAHKEYNVTEILDVLRRAQAHDGQRQIARSTGIDRKTIRKYLAIAGECDFTPLTNTEELHEIAAAVFRKIHLSEKNAGTSANEKVLLPHKETISGWLHEDDLTLTKVHIKLQRMGVQVDYGALYRFARKYLEFGGKKVTVRMAETAPGEVAEVDFGRLGLVYDPASGKTRVLHALVVTLVMSRHQYVYATHRQNIEALIAGIEAAFEFFGGVTRRLVIDNMKAAVVKADRYEPVFNRMFLEYSEHRGFIIDPAPVRSPTAKATVERQVPYVRENFFKGEKFIDRDHVQREAENWCRTTAGFRIHGTTRKRPVVVFEEEERSHLKPLSAERFDVPIWSVCKVHPDHHIRFGHALYSLPTGYIGKEVGVRGDSRLVRIYHNEQIIKTHPKKAKGRRSTDFADYPKEKSAYAMRDCQYYIRKGGEKGESVGKFMEALFAGDFPWARMREAQKLIRLTERYGVEKVEAACTRALAFGLINVHRVEGMILKAPAHTGNASKAAVITARFERKPDYFCHTNNTEKENTNGNTV